MSARGTGRVANVVLAALLGGLAGIGDAGAGIEAAGTTAANFLSIGVGARAPAMAGAGLGIADDAGGAATNPAALGWVHAGEAALAHASLPDGRLQDWATLGGRIGGRGTRWALSGHYQSEGSFAGTDDTGASTGDFTVSSLALGATLAQQLAGRATLGVTVKGVREQIASVSGTGVTFDTGLMLRAGPLGIGVAAQNLGGRVAFGASSYPFPTSVGVGLGLSHPAAGLRLALDANFPRAYHADLRAGAEWTHRGALALRAGYRHELGSPADPLNGPTFGLGASHRGMWLDYGYLLSGDGTGQHRMGLRLPLGRGSRGGGSAAAPAGDPDWAREGGRLGPGGPAKAGSRS